MSNARKFFLESVEGLRHAIDTYDLTDKLPERARDAVAAVHLRNGLYIQGFCALEDFMKRRSSEVLDAVITDATILWSSFPTSLRQRYLTQPLLALEFRNKIGMVADYWVERERILTRVGTLGGTPRQSVDHVFGFGASNLSSADVKSFCVDLQCTDIFAQAHRICAHFRVQGLVQNREEQFKTISSVRHQCAHNAEYSVTLALLQGLPEDMCVIAMSFDYHLARFSELLRHNPGVFTTRVDSNFFEPTKGSICRIDVAGRYLLYRDVTARGISKSAAAWTEIINYCNARPAQFRLVCLVDAAGKLSGWHLVNAT